LDARLAAAVRVEDGAVQRQAAGIDGFDRRLDLAQMGVLAEEGLAQATIHRS